MSKQENRIFNQIIENQELTSKTIFQPSMSNKSYIEKVEEDFLVECEAFTRLDGNNPYDKEGMDILKSFIRLALTKAFEEVGKDVKRALLHKARHTNDQNIYNAGLETALRILKKYKE